MKSSQYVYPVIQAASILLSLILSGVPTVIMAAPTLIEADQQSVKFDLIEGVDGQYRLLVESEEGRAADWIVHAIEIPADEITDLYKLRNNRTTYTDESFEIDQVYAPAKSLFRYGDLIGDVIDIATKGSLFDSTLSQDLIEVSDSEDTVLLVRAFSGGWGYMVDKDEAKFVTSSVHLGEERSHEALSMNVFVAIIDVISLSIPLDTILGDPSLLAEVTLAFNLSMSENLAADFLTDVEGDKDERAIELLHRFAIVGNDVFAAAAKNLSKEVGKKVSENALQETASFFAKSAKVALDTVNVVDKASTAGKFFDRVMELSLTSSAMETAYVVPEEIYKELYDKGGKEKIEDILRSGSIFGHLDRPENETEEGLAEEEGGSIFSDAGVPDMVPGGDTGSSAPVPEKVTVRFHNQFGEMYPLQFPLVSTKVRLLDSGGTHIANLQSRDLNGVVVQQLTKSIPPGTYQIEWMENILPGPTVEIKEPYDWGIVQRVIERGTAQISWPPQNGWYVSVPTDQQEVRVCGTPGFPVQILDGEGNAFTNRVFSIALTDSTGNKISENLDTLNLETGEYSIGWWECLSPGAYSFEFTPRYKPNYDFEPVTKTFTVPDLSRNTAADLKVHNPLGSQDLGIVTLTAK